MEINLSKNEQGKITKSLYNKSFNDLDSFIKSSTFTESYSYNKSTDKLDSFKRKLRTQNYFEEDNDINIIYPSTK